ncbi:ADP-ribosylation factor-like protein 16 [Histomonas meleagridis]|uniref:ADP-ribosylation factor-like protein 16 n=1 Tax=Histomonas meleagridis TaxID=135588 RepID=UPI003559EC2D|nr:ADP-ribosylation factor-like protein 16 [Histomonas meleagridis]KAH0798841.1 ADP-ribosylation factor-like protein 16 [Histomonas meleagridis]
MQALCNERRLTPFDPIPNTKPTENIKPTSFKYKSSTINIRELGGPMISSWEENAKTAKGIIYIYDAADYLNTANNVVWLHDLLTNEQFEQIPVLVVLNKCDVPTCIRFPAIDQIIGFDRTLNPSRISFLEASALVGVGMSDIFHWIYKIIGSK